MNKNFQIGDRVQYRSGGNWKPFGEIVEILEPLTMNGATLVGPKYRVKWDESGETSGWLSYHEIQRAE